MSWTTLETHLSSPRMQRYLDDNQGDKLRAVDAYTHNLLISEALMPLLHVLEVSLRNGIHQRMTIHHGRADWYEVWRGNSLFREQYAYVTAAQRKLLSRQEVSTPDKLIAELSFGFWVSLFNRKVIMETSKPLLLTFTRCPKGQRRPEPIRAKLNKIRVLRNRCFHHEPLLWMPLHALHTEAQDVIQWISPDLQFWLSKHDRFPVVFAAWHASPRILC